ncbi:MAG: aminotransferase class V-fold PLP-dependent enzyme [Clostridia bacterium]|nr:aminotransferase class V-fold PLP-dependent enzyme [Clostridia bacterium]
MIYLDNAATTLKKPESVIRAVEEAMRELGNAGRGAHEAALAGARGIYEARKELADFFGADDPRRVVFTANSTEALNIAIRGLFDPGDHVITTVMEHNSVLRPLYACEEEGTELTFIGLKEEGGLDLGKIPAAIKNNTKAIICTHASNLTGDLTDLSAVAGIARKYGLLLIVDASQTAGEQPIRVDESGIDVLCFTGHKGLFGPQGTGGMIVRDGLRIRPLKSGGTGVQTYRRTQPEEMPTHLEAGTLNGHGIAGLAAAVRFIQEEGLERIREKEESLMRCFYERVRGIDGVRIYGDFGAKRRCPIVALNIRDYDSSEVSDVLYTEYGIATRPGAHCAPLLHQALGTVEQGAVRFSFSYFNTEEECKTAAGAIRELAGQ